MTDKTYLRLAGTITALGLIGAAVAAILYAMALPIFDATDLSWIFFYGLISAAIGVLTLVLRGIWEA
jgi:hypothetical protein